MDRNARNLSTASGDRWGRCLLFGGFTAALLVALCCTALQSRSHAGPVPSSRAPRFEIVDASVQAAVAKASSLLGKRIVLSVSPSHPSRRAQVSLSMPVGEPNDLLNALASAYGLRWMSGHKAQEVRLVGKDEYRTTPGGLRQAVSDALHPKLQQAVTAPEATRLPQVEGILKEINAEQLEKLEALTANGTVTLDRLDPSLSDPLVRYLDSFAAYRLGQACDQTVQHLRTNRTTRFHYGANPRGNKQVTFGLGNNQWLAVDPE